MGKKPWFLKGIAVMDNKKCVKTVTDIFMTILLMLLMFYGLTGQYFHEYAGAAMFLLFILHHILNYKWWKNMLSGKFSSLKIIIISVNLLLLLDMIGLLISGIIMSRYAFSFLNIRIGVSGARMIHMICSYWGFALMSAHIGLHWNIVIRSLKKAPKPIIYISRILAAIIAAFGLYAFIKNRLWAYMTGTEQFVLMDYGQSGVWTVLEYMSIMGMFICITYYTFTFIKGLCYDKK